MLRYGEGEFWESIKGLVIPGLSEAAHIQGREHAKGVAERLAIVLERINERVSGVTEGYPPHFYFQHSSGQSALFLWRIVAPLGAAAANLFQVISPRRKSNLIISRGPGIASAAELEPMAVMAEEFSRVAKEECRELLDRPLLSDCPNSEYAVATMYLFVRLQWISRGTIAFNAPDNWDKR